MIDLGAFELSKEEFTKNSKAKSFLPLSLPDTFPDYFVKTTKVPKAISCVWKKATDRHCDKNIANYFFKEDDAIVLIAYGDLPDAAAKLRVEQLQRELVLDLKSYLAGGDDKPFAASDAEKKKQKQSDENLIRVLKEGLRKNPKIEEVKIWAERALQNFSMGQDMPQEVRKLISDYKFAYNPVYNSLNSTIVGAVMETNPKGIMPKRVEDVMRDNMAAINAAHIQIATMLKNGQRALVMASIDVRVFVQPEVKDLLIMSLKKMSPEVRQLLVIEIRGIRGKKVPPKLADLLGTINVLCRSLVIDTGILSCPDFSRYNFKPFAYSFNYSEVRLPEEQRISLMKKYSKTYKALKAKTLIKNVPNKSLFFIAEKMGFTFLSGPMVFPPQLKCPLPRKINLQPPENSE